MQVFKAFFKLIKNYKIGLFLYFGLCLLMTVVVSSSYGDDAEDSAYSNVSRTLIVKDNDNSELSKAVVDYLKSQHDVEAHDYTKDEIKDLIYSEFYTAYIEIPKGFMDKHLEDDALTIKTLYDTAKAGGSFISLQLDSFTGGVVRYENAGYSLSEAIENTNKSIKTENFVELGKKVEDDNTNSKLYSLFLFLPYGIMTMVLWCALPVILRFNSKEIKDRTAISAILPVKRTIALFMGATVVCIAVYLILLILSSCFLADFVFTRKWFLSALNLLVFSVVNGAFLVFFSSFSSEKLLKAKDMLINIITIAFAFLGGIFVPLELLGEDVKNVGRLLPTYWYAVGLEKIENGSALSDIASCFGMQAVFGVFCLAAGLAISRVHLYLKEN